jgi:hypothetical protein
MSLRGRIAGLLDVRRAASPPEHDRRVEQLEERLAQIEALVQGLQDAVHRDSVRHEERMSALERRTEPEALAKALSDDSRRRGL